MDDIAKRNVDIIRGWYEGGVWNTHDVAAANAYIDKHYAATGRVYGLGESFVEGPEVFKAFRRGLLAAFPDLTVKVLHYMGQDDMVSVYFVARMTHAGKPLELSGSGFARLEGEQVVEAWNTLAVAELLEQLGDLPRDTFPSLLGRLANANPTAQHT